MFAPPQRQLCGSNTTQAESEITGCVLSVAWAQSLCARFPAVRSSQEGLAAFGEATSRWENVENLKRSQGIFILILVHHVHHTFAKIQMFRRNAQNYWLLVGGRLWSGQVLEARGIYWEVVKQGCVSCLLVLFHLLSLRLTFGTPTVTDAISGSSRLCSLMLSCVLVRFRFTRVESAYGEKGIWQTTKKRWEKNAAAVKRFFLVMAVLKRPWGMVLKNLWLSCVKMGAQFLGLKQFPSDLGSWPHVDDCVCPTMVHHVLGCWFQEGRCSQASLNQF